MFTHGTPIRALLSTIASLTAILWLQQFMPTWLDLAIGVPCGIAIGLLGAASIDV